ncbi:hypothetical protein C8J57DRAFT_1503242 [Mycena rebaudengoi]|nr:hypothetical protein C8J57DRAFT_1503242 [Mycena rebaudengoi]
MGVLSSHSPLCDGKACAAALRRSFSGLAVQMLVEHLSRAQDARFLGARITTLNPRFICPNDFLALSHRKTFCFSFTHSRGKGPGADIAYQYINLGVEPFPPHARARQRHCDTHKFARLHEQLLHERMVSNALMSRCHAIFANRRNIHPELTIWGLQHPLLINFGTSLCLTMVGPAAAHETELQPFIEWMPEIPGTRPRQLSRPLTGSGVACLERSALPARASSSCASLRFLSPLRARSKAMPARQVRELLMVSFRDGPPQPWAYGVDRKTQTEAALRG